MSQRTVTVEINQQQASMLDRLIAEGRHGSSYREVVRSGLLDFRRQHPELGATPASARSREEAGGA
jgi:Arc/MetJ-type ribon-helix-helix transcriptional regulator